MTTPLLSVKPTTPRLALWTACCLAATASLSAQAPSYPIGQGPFGQPQVQPPAPPQTQPGQPYPSDPTRPSGPYQNPREPARGWEQPGRARNQAATISPLAPVQVATPEAKAFSLAAMADKPIRSPAQEILGTLTDFLIDPRTGKVEFAVVPSGVNAAGETYRLIPAGALELNNAAEGLRAKINQAQWQQVEDIPDRQLRGSITLNPTQRQRLDQQFGLTSSSDPRMQTTLVRTSELRGKTLQTWGQQLGVLQDVAVDVRHQIAGALVNSTDSALGAAQTFLVAFPHLQVGRPEQSTINTPLTAAHFQQAQQAQVGLPTGPNSSPFASTGPAGDTAATAVRQALDRNPAWARANVQVVPETRIRLHGTVPDEQTRSNIERTAKEAAPGLRVDNHITVQGGNR